ncbi:MAG: hypothetical protein ISS46_02025 [Candidatus Omnitrophica bacterium]|nr:hypothetical protein [Candidatus Omnitrophota bacterium]
MSFDRILKTPFFGISTENIGIQISDMIGHIIGRRFTGDRLVQEFFNYTKEIQFESKKKIRMFSLKGIKVIKKKRAGDLTTQE